ncbi:MAG: beta-ketoacyl-ACP reductase [Rhizobiales bacterium 24-66-13]|jgi:NAD(P)-dependent dehydrogenase (short-subunit alcohol dehydrogenase family)|uniref:3-oxoacyl-ACP reductase FabG n=1 Tax=Roseixanthobacter finlandensis TaxID=3119922 RepID=UPI000BDD78FE|nr:MAG: beta-ketoacyl-ACP reductase [Rhizobiales bacterium 35-66-30]OYZ81652.1 MAG: beta-ketoacyl-ACP reductase [Rhizobiales bacterium 24-66-13]OZB09101.1 MAG: beta-ketoacyl-ACP reductase [Rhizobiales bacterium 39-66-18]HQS09333.1 3-oxoacyl-ACP reductase FabG [Xanthobacteraceae bacterium]HQS47515.1 3-oxoacyl-ACP reductase FabG [Xanthobacteraceae bacterium]
MRVEERAALVTGAGSGIGAAIARRLAGNGARVAIVDRDGAAAEAAAEAICADGGTAFAVAADATEAGEVERAVAHVHERFGSLDILVNNVGIVRDNYLTRMPEEDWDAVLTVNLKSYFLCSKAAAGRMMAQRRGRVVNVSSRAWLGNPGQANYSAAKAGIVGLTRSMAIELGKFDITVNCVAPGFIDTPLTRALKPEVWERMVKAQPIARIGTAEEVAYAVQFFASDEAFYMNGQVLYVCGGKSLGAFGSA